VQHRPAGVVFPEQVENVRIGEGIAPTPDDRQQLGAGTEQFQGGVEICALISGAAGLRGTDGAGGFFPGVPRVLRM
jgi:hypothetical protein